MKKAVSILLVSLMILSFSGCSSNNKVTEKKVAEKNVSDKLTIYCPHPIEFIDPVVNEFESQSGIKVEVVAAGTGELLKRVEAEGTNPLGDILWGGSLSTLEPKKDLFEKYQSVNEKDVFDDYKNKDGQITRFTVIPSVIMINTKLIGDIKVEGFEDLLNPALKGKIANADPAKSSSSFEQIINQLYAMGNGEPEKGWDYVTKLTKNLDGKLLSGSSAVYKGVGDGEYTVGLTFEEAAAKYVKDGAPVKLVYSKEGTVAKADGVVIIKGAKNMENAKKFIDFVTGKDAQTLIANKLNRRSVRTDVPPAEGLKPLEDIKVIKDDEAWLKENKQNILDKYKEIITSN
ncbi:extracellular solute-binding protein [Clostridium sp.]|uniref:ABC transporter substrate-binding protein n=1 Tax=Clostridium sp. TaxID=1506 RepID=UPI003D6C8BCA